MSNHHRFSDTERAVIYRDMRHFLPESGRSYRIGSPARRRIACAIQDFWLAARAEGLGMSGCHCLTLRNWRNCSICPSAASQSLFCAWVMANPFIRPRC
ncbi:hypothetical protein [Nitrosomonas sp. Nm166]|uniref:hypothetical protein n=1 Tax=Nitrosomonas sp. Nm166 TaxID=1881054 RepID=UPI00210D69BC|nr:hypothetical protein [Nitrosomonas sp. Nm166]